MYMYILLRLDIGLTFILGPTDTPPKPCVSELSQHLSK